jgi:arylsulfatase A-like enzyme
MLGLLGSLGVLETIGCSEQTPGAPERIVLVVVDTLRADHLSPYGAELATPNIARLAETGQVFTNAIASFHQTTMSMAALFTGRTPSLETGNAAELLPWTGSTWCGMSRFATSAEASCIPEPLGTLAEDLAAAGFETIGVQSNALIFRPYGYDRGFDSWIEVSSDEAGDRLLPRRARDMARRDARAGQRVNTAALAALDDRTSDRFFLYIHYMDPHDYGLRADIKRYADGVMAVDRAVGELLDRLREDGLLENAVVVFTSDHGEYLGAPHALTPAGKHFGNPSVESLLRVPLIVSPPQPGDPTRLVRGQDVRSLIREIAGLAPIPASDVAADEVFLTELYFQTYRRGQWKSTFSRNGLRVALFDLTADPGETRNLAELRPEIVEQHRRRINEITSSLGTQRGAKAELSADDAQRLRALGYLE